MENAMTLNIGIPQSSVEPHLQPRITVVGVGGGGGNAVNNMIDSTLCGVEFVIANTDAQALATSKAKNKIQMGSNATAGLGAGAQPNIGREAAEECREQMVQYLEGANMAFITAGMGGGTGTGAAPVFARVARELGVLTVGVVTKPFHFEGKHRMEIAQEGINELTACVDTLIVIPNQNLFRVANEKTPFAQAFNMADDVLYSGVRSITDLMMIPSLINLDFADVKTVMLEMGRAMIGTGEAEGENRAIKAAESAIANPLLEDTSMQGAKGVLINITGGSDITLYEIDEAATRIREEVKTESHIIFGHGFDENLEGKIRVSVVATGIDSPYEKLQPVSDEPSKPFKPWKSSNAVTPDGNNTDLNSPSKILASQTSQNTTNNAALGFQPIINEGITDSKTTDINQSVSSKEIKPLLSQQGIQLGQTPSIDVTGIVEGETKRITGLAPTQPSIKSEVGQDEKKSDTTNGTRRALSGAYRIFDKITRNRTEKNKAEHKIDSKLPFKQLKEISVAPIPKLSATETANITSARNNLAVQVNSQEEEELRIPAFLRRQAN